MDKKRSRAITYNALIESSDDEGFEAHDLIDSDEISSAIRYNALIESSDDVDSDDEGRKEKRQRFEAHDERFEPMNNPLRKAQILKGNVNDPYECPLCDVLNRGITPTDQQHTFRYGCKHSALDMQEPGEVDYFQQVW